jgi:hypothetical protein
MGSHKPITINDQIDFISGQLPLGYLCALPIGRALLQYWPGFPKEIRNGSFGLASIGAKPKACL